MLPRLPSSWYQPSSSAESTSISTAGAPRFPLVTLISVRFIIPKTRRKMQDENMTRVWFDKLTISSRGPAFNDVGPGCDGPRTGCCHREGELAIGRGF